MAEQLHFSRAGEGEGGALGELARTAPLSAALMLETVERLEAKGPLNDTAALRVAFASGPTRSQQVLARAWLLGERLGLPQVLVRWRLGMQAAALGLAVAMALGGFVLAQALLGQGRTLNAVAACASLLALPTVTLLGWLALLVLQRVGRGKGGALLWRLVLWLAARLPGVRGPLSLELAPAAVRVLQRHGLTMALSGTVTHVTWALSLLLTLLVLVCGFAFHAYRLGWESTLFGPETFDAFVRASGALPKMLGFAVPDAGAVAQAAHARYASPEGQRAWAWWLMGCVTVYGLLPRLVLAAVCGWLWRRRMQQLRQQLATLDLSAPYFSRITARLDALEPPAPVIDPERRPPPSASAPKEEAPAAPAAPLPEGAAGAPAFAIAFELPPDWQWPRALPGAPAGVYFDALDGSSAARRGALATLAAARPPALLLAVRAASSPDRGTARFVREAAPTVQRAALWLLPEAAEAEAAAAVDAARWSAWLEAEELTGAPALASRAAAAAWLTQAPSGAMAK